MRKQKANPFGVGQPIQTAADFIGRKAILQKILNDMLNRQNVSLHGERRTGKTWLLHYLAYYAPLETIGLPATHVPVYLGPIRITSLIFE
jgi:hypothetical protein